ncbi:MAG: ACP S-malonyltransferase [Chitinophagaceae bacterium]|nr:MAG: ACP S-malonyltransferase [Chitinophagaceae bacterium]
MKHAFIFPGQGSQFPGMGKEHYENSAFAKKLFEQANEVLGFRISEVMFNGTEEDLKQTNVTQPAVFLHSVVAYKTIEGAKPDMTAGHSLGEFSALVANGALRFEDALKVAGKKHDIVGIKVYDKMEMRLPDIGLVQVQDAETGETAFVDTSDNVVRQQYQSAFFQHTEYCKTVFLKSGSDLLHIATDEDYVKVLKKFFIGRNK